MPPEVVSRPISFTGLTVAGVVVGLGEARALRANRTVDAQDMLVAYGLGSCVALCLWDADTQVAGMAHVVLPGEDPTGAPNPRFARSALPALMDLMRAEGAACDPRRLVARLVGGAQVLSMPSVNGQARVGEANARGVRETLADSGVYVEAYDLGGCLGRSVWFSPRDGGHIRVRAIGSTDRYL